MIASDAVYLPTSQIPHAPTLAIDFKKGDAKWHAYRERAKTDLYWLTNTVLGYGELIPMRPNVHGLLCKFVERRTGSPLLDTKRYRKIELPRDVGKTTIVTQGYVIQRILQDPNISILLCNEKELTAKDILGSIKFEFESNELLRALFPEIIPPDLNDTVWSASRIVVNRTTGRKEPTVFVIGVGGTVTGMHPNVILVDDMISREAMENARAGAWQIMYQTNRWINQLDMLLSKSKTDIELLFIGTRWWHKDSYEHVEDAFGNGEQQRTVLLRMKLEDGEVQQVPAFVKGDLAIFRRAAIENGRSIFPEKWSLDDLAKMRVRDPALFACNMMNNPTDEITATFKEHWLKTLTWLDDDFSTFHIVTGAAERKVIRVEDLDRIIIIDPGGFAERLIEDRARASVVVLGDDHRGHKFFLDCYSEQDTYLVAIQQAVDFTRRYSPRKIYVERAGQQVAFAQLLRLALVAAQLSCIVDDTTLKPGNTAKDVRVLEMEPYYQAGEFYVGTGSSFLEFRQQYSQFPRAMRKDIIDVLGYYPRLLRKTTPNSNQRPEQRQAQEREMARSRMASLRRGR